GPGAVVLSVGSGGGEGECRESRSRGGDEGAGENGGAGPFVGGRGDAAPPCSGAPQSVDRLYRSGPTRCRPDSAGRADSAAETAGAGAHEPGQQGRRPGRPGCGRRGRGLGVGAESAIGGSGSVGGRGGGGGAVLSSAVTSRLVDAPGREPGPERAQDLTERAHIARGPALAEQRRQKTRDRVDQHHRKARGRVLAVAREQWGETGCQGRTVRRLAVRGIGAVATVAAVDDRAQ